MTTKLALPCPRCGQALDPKVFGTVTIDVCGSCGGHWYDAGELERIRELAPGERPQDQHDVAPRWVDSKHDAISCPRCRQPLGSERYAYSSDLVLDRCANCNGVWVDAGELDRMDQLIAEWSRDLAQDEAKWAARRGSIEATLGQKFAEAGRGGRHGVVIGYLLRKLGIR